ncbi:hypothetical protein [Sphingopyxis panaciterrulae]|uniref:Uncharacterized protein n=1 Tax=Sphingopyxis panaciterrulae TaxID=462372 RepID=A0A7W9B7I5_9SPHN|nr:hypothetical protein [Sphingopyxis panaciterrulae]MBB5707422.1 hypothetical protein [Sphingopyxis panaciterrulae]
MPDIGAFLHFLRQADAFARNIEESVRGVPVALPRAMALAPL